MNILLPTKRGELAGVFNRRGRGSWGARWPTTKATSATTITSSPATTTARIVIPFPISWLQELIDAQRLQKRTVLSPPKKRGKMAFYCGSQLIYLLNSLFTVSVLFLLCLLVRTLSDHVFGQIHCRRLTRSCMQLMKIIKQAYQFNKDIISFFERELFH